MNTELPDTITIEITEEDRQKAVAFVDFKNCIIATALKRMGYEHASVGTIDITVNGQDYDLDKYCGCDELKDLTIDNSISCAPFYGKGVVGKKFVATKHL